jgi:hypothetical protein
VIVRILPEAEEELYQAALWYEDREEGVGVRLLTAYDVAVIASRNEPTGSRNSKHCRPDETSGGRFCGGSLHGCV